MAGIILVRHAMPEVVRGVSSTLWELGEAALEDCVLLAHALPHELAPAVFTSHQPKVKQTAGVLALRRGLEVLEDERLREVGQGPAWIDDYRAAAARYLQDGSGGETADWEPRERAVERFAAGVDAAMAANSCSPGDVVIVNHGLAMSLWLASRSGIDLVPFWQGLAFPDAWRLDLETGEVRRLWPGGRAAE
ncbi:MAG: phosphoglycerate mutase family protein [Dehalococcoidia bacterium]|nr:phosphoglycerate mutase family protein [Dehalococcoidia bacterium]